MPDRSAELDMTPREIGAMLLEIAEELGWSGQAKVATRLRRIAAHVKPPTLVGILKTLEHPRTWPTRSHALWLAGRLSVAAHLVREFLRDAEITGSEETADTARQWLESLGVEAPEAVDMMALAPKRAPKLLQLAEGQDAPEGDPPDDDDDPDVS